MISHQEFSIYDDTQAHLKKKKNSEGDICYLGQDTGINIPDKQKRPRLPQSPGVES